MPRTIANILQKFIYMTIVKPYQLGPLIIPVHRQEN